MRFRLVERKAGAPRRLPAASAPEKTPPAPPRAADLDNPYGRYYGKARSLGSRMKLAGYARGSPTRGAVERKRD